MQNAGIAALGLNWRYLAFEVATENLSAAIQGAKQMNFIGLNLTVPHKLLAVDMVDALDESAKAWGAVNTIRFEAQNAQGQWRPVGEFADPADKTRAQGFNTDADAIVRSLNEDLGFHAPGKKALVLGAGGAGRTAALRLAAEGIAELFLVNRTRDKAEAVQKEIHSRFPKSAVRIGYPSGAVDLVLNATSLGLKPNDALPFSKTDFSLERAATVFDMIYRPAETPLLGLAKQAGCRVANGLGMLLYQGVKALEIWSERPAPVEIMARALRQNVYGQKQTNDCARTNG
jgi:shikimate dehydrogenase